MSPLVSIIDQKQLDIYKNKLPHALIISGEDGLDRSSAVDLLANFIPSELVIIQPLEDKKTISAEQVREISSKLRTFTDKRRVVRIRLAEYMTETAQNALLKMLEEPATNVHFLLESVNSSALLSTIISRSQEFKLHRTSDAQDTELLSKSNLDKISIEQIKFIASGRPQLISELIAEPKLLDSYRQYITDAKVFFMGDAYEALLVINRYSSDRAEAQKLVDIVITLGYHQLKMSRLDRRVINLLERSERVERSLNSNGHIKLSLLQLTS